MAALSPDRAVKLHGWLAGVKVTLPAEPDPAGVRDVVREISTLRAQVARVFGEVAPRLGTLRAEQRRLERKLERDDAAARDTGRGLFMTKNAEERKARLLVNTSSTRDQLAALEEELAVVRELSAHALFVRDELQAAFESASRVLASIELERRIEGLA